MKQHKTTISYFDIELEITFNYYEEEKQWFDPIQGVGGPGHPAEIELLSVKHKGEDIMEIIKDFILGEIEDQLIDQDWNEQ